MKGFVSKGFIVSNLNQVCTINPDNTIHVHQTSPDAIEGEAVVREGLYDEIDSPRNGFINNLPAALIGKRVRWIIEVIEEGE